MPSSQVAYGWFHPRDRTRVASIEAALGEMDPAVSIIAFDPSDPAPDDGVLFVFLSPSLLESYAAQVGPVARAWPGAVVPVYLDEVSLPAQSPLAERARIGPGWEVDLVAARIAEATLAPPEWWTAWRPIESAAKRAGEGSVERSDLLGPRQIELAEKLMVDGPAPVVEAARQRLNRLLDQSRKSIHRRRRRVRAVALALTGLFVVAAASAWLQRSQALDASAEARASAVRSEADRLARLADQYIGNDPDLPTIFAHRAYRLESSPEAREALRRALDATPLHRSYRLSEAPSGLATTPRSSLVVVLAAGTAALVDSADGSLITSVPARGAGAVEPVATISPDGRSVALAYDDGVVEVRSMEPSFQVVRDLSVRHGAGRVAGLVWTGADSLLAAWGSGPAFELELSSGKAFPLKGAAVGPVSGIGAAGGGLEAVVGERRVAVFAAAGARPCMLKKAPPASPGASVVLDRVNRYLVVSGGGNLAYQMALPPACLRPGGRTPEERLLAPGSGSTTATGLPGGGLVIGTAFGQLIPLVPGALYPASPFLAHTGPVTGAGVGFGGRLVTVGGDRWLRVWESPPTPPAYPSEPGYNVSVGEGYVDDSTRSTWRSMLAVTPAGEVRTGGFSNGLLAIGSLDDLAPSSSSAFLYVSSSIRPTASEPCRAMVVGLGGAVTVVGCQSGRFQTVWRRPDDIGPGMLNNAAISPDGDTVVLWNPREVELTPIPDGPAHLVSLEGLRAGGFDRRGDFVGVRSDGTIATIDGDGEVKRVAVDLEGHPVVAASPSSSADRVLLVSADGLLTLADTWSGRIISSFSVDASLGEAFDVQLSSDDRRALIVGKSSYWVVDVARRRLLLESISSDWGVGAMPRDAAFLEDGRALLILRADEGLVRVPVERWRELDGDRLLDATAAMVPRAARASEERAPVAIGRLPG